MKKKTISLEYISYIAGILCAATILILQNLNFLPGISPWLVLAFDLVPMGLIIFAFTLKYKKDKAAGLDTRKKYRLQLVLIVISILIITLYPLLTKK